ncbi:YceH family protein [Desulfopila sp. IMCC35008]|uniref:YceH family protein n=1 Tax=Desulfopila sp. IMCC35008 TaxID=2653858 RepID=UPI0013D2C16B|nr:YceH family protein [Desulfopila sp. IMCC35008]
MEILLTETEIRILGCLIEKEMATPDYYPLSLNALINACNQKSNRNPVVSYDEETVLSGLDGLREQKLVRESNLSRVPKYEQIFSQGLNLLAAEQAIICILLVRGPQTIGEIRGRTERLFAFSGIEQVQDSLTNLEELGLVMKLPRQPGRKEHRYAHLFAGIPQETPVETEQQPGISTRFERLSELEQQVDELRNELHQLRQDFVTFKSQFE